ncbi:MAG: HAD-IA family hydrolase [Gammaproteobacteria bacterium]|nr:HAD-IA family hydrolase [Gammaproteobacteria bacterium]
MRYELLIFDWDGTLADSVGTIVASMQAAIDALDLPPRSDRQIAELIGLGFNDGLARLYPQLDASVTRALIDGYRRCSQAVPPQPRLFPGALPALYQLHRRGYRLALATGRSREALQRALGAFPELTGMLQATRCADETADKPDPRMLEELLDELAVPAASAVMVGDTDYDIAMAAALEVHALGVASGGHDSGRLLRAGALAVLPDVGALPDWLRSSG